MADQIAAPGLVREIASHAAAGDRTVLGVDRDLSRVFDIDDATKVKLAGDRVAEIGKTLTSYDAVSAGLFVIAPSLVDVLAELRSAVADGGRGGRRRARPGRRARRRHQAVAGPRQRRDEAARRMAAARLRRRARASGDAGGAAVGRRRHAGADRTVARREGPAGVRAVQPRSRDDLGAGEGVARALRRLSPRRRLRRRRRAPAGEAAACLRRVAGARDAAPDGFGDRRHGDVDRVRGSSGQEAARDRQRRVR